MTGPDHAAKLQQSESQSYQPEESGLRVPRNDTVITDEVLVETLKKHRGIAKDAAHELRMSRSTLYKHLKRNPYLKDALNDIREEALDYVESKLFELIDKGHPSAIIFFLKCQGKHRGYVERQEVTGRDGAELLPIIAPPRATSMEEWVEQNQIEASSQKRQLEE